MSAVSLASFDATIAGGGTEAIFSDIDMKGRSINRLFIPDNFAGTSLTVNEQGPEPDTGFYPVNDTTGAGVSITVAAGSFVAVNVGFFARTRPTKLVSNVAQGAETPCVLTAYICEVG